jgi:hypothetical protein
MGSLDLIDYQVGSRKLPYCQVGKGGKMNSEESSDQQGVLTGEGQKYILIIGGIEVFLPSIPVEARGCVVDTTTECGQPTNTVMDEEMEQTLMSTLEEGDRHSEEWLKSFGQKVGTKMTATLELAAGEEVNDIDFVGLCEEFESLEKRVTVQSLHIQ